MASSTIDLEMDEFTVSKVRKDRKTIEIVFSPTFHTSDLDTYLKTLSLHADLNLIELSTEYTSYKAYLSVEVLYSRAHCPLFELRMGVNSFSKNITQSSGSHRSLHHMILEVLFNNGVIMKQSSELVMREVQKCTLVISDFKPAVTRSSLSNPNTRRQLFGEGTLRMPLFFNQKYFYLNRITIKIIFYLVYKYFFIYVICRSRAVQEIDVPRAARPAETRARRAGHAEVGEEATRSQASTDRCGDAVSARSSAGAVALAGHAFESIAGI